MPTFDLRKVLTSPCAYYKHPLEPRSSDHFPTLIIIIIVIGGGGIEEWDGCYGSNSIFAIMYHLSGEAQSSVV